MVQSHPGAPTGIIMFKEYFATILETNKEYYVSGIRSGVIFYIDESGDEKWTTHDKVSLRELLKCSYYVLSLRDKTPHFMEGGQHFETRRAASEYVKNYKGKLQLTIIAVPNNTDKDVQVVKVV